jgi:hypothetical protein
MVIADVTNPAQPVQVGQGILPAYGYTTASAMADGITLTNKVAYVGTWQDGGNLYGFDCSTAAYPRLVAVMPEGSQICESVLTLQNDGTDLFDGGALDDPFVDINFTGIQRDQLLPDLRVCHLFRTEQPMRRRRAVSSCAAGHLLVHVSSLEETSLALESSGYSPWIVCRRLTHWSVAPCMASRVLHGDFGSTGVANSALLEILRPTMAWFGAPTSQRRFRRR